MKYILAHDETFPCRQCGVDNFTFAPFCHECGAQISGNEKGSPPLHADEEGSDGHPGPGASEELRAGTASRRPHWETVIGLLLVVLVLGYVVVSWIGGTNQSNAYHEGLAAIEHKDWDLAAAKLVEAGDHPNAQARLGEVTKARDERDRLYTAGVDAIERGRWYDARLALRGVEEIQPAYKESTRLLALAEANWEKQSLAGIVYLQGSFQGQVPVERISGEGSLQGRRTGPQNQPPGLYLRDFTGATVMLPGSDAQSLVRAISEDGLEIVYDRPGNADLSPLHAATPNPSRVNGEERTLVLASLGRDGSAAILTTIPIPSLHPDGTGVFSQFGLWWYSPRGPSTFDGYDLYYSRPDYLSPSATVRVNTLGGSGRVVALDAARSRVIIAESIGEERSSTKRSRLFIAGPAGEDPQLLHELAGDIYQATFSPDGAWSLYVAQSNSAKITRTVWVLPLLEGNQGSPSTGSRQVLQSRGRPRQMSSLSWSGLEMNVGLAASFLPLDGRQHVVISKTDGNTEQLNIYALEIKQGAGGLAWQLATSAGEKTHNLSSGAWTAGRLDAGAFSHDGRYMVSTRRQKGEAALLELGDRQEGAGSMQAHIGWTQQPIRVFSQQTMRLSFAPRDDYLVATIRNPDGINRGSTDALYVLPVEGNDSTQGSRLGQPRYAGGASLLYRRDMPAIALPPDGSVLVYVNPARDLVAVSFDDMAQTVVAQNVKAVWSLRADSNLTWWR